MELNGKVLYKNKDASADQSIITISSPDMYCGGVDVQDGRPDVAHHFTIDSDGLWHLNEESGRNTLYGGVITGGRAIYGGAFNIGNGGSLMIVGGNIVGNTAKYGGAIYAENVNPLQIGGNIIGNVATSSGGGIFANQAKSIGIYGGTISNNHAIGEYGNGGGMSCYASTVVIYDGTISNNYATAGRYGNGGGISILNGSTLTIVDGTITENVANNGGGISATSSTVIINGGTISNNHAITEYGDGGGIISGSGSVEINGGVIDGNTAVRHGGGMAVFTVDDSETKFIITDGHITNNKAAQGAGVYSINTPFTISGGEISGNTATTWGGGIYVSGLNETTSELFSISEGLINNNKVLAETGDGGGISIICSKYEIKGGKIINNESQGCGGGISIGKFSSGSLLGGTISGNKAKIGGGVYYNSANPLTVGNSIVIIDNTVTGTSQKSNLYMLKPELVSVDSQNPFTDTAVIGITLKAGIGNVTGICKDDYSSVFYSDSDDYKIAFEDGRIVLLVNEKPATEVSVVPCAAFKVGNNNIIWIEKETKVDDLNEKQRISLEILLQQRQLQLVSCYTTNALGLNAASLGNIRIAVALSDNDKDNLSEYVIFAILEDGTIVQIEYEIDDNGNVIFKPIQGAYIFAKNM